MTGGRYIVILLLTEYALARGTRGESNLVIDEFSLVATAVTSTLALALVAATSY